MSDLHQYAKWFALWDYHFSLNHVDSMWQVTAWSKGGEAEPIHGDRFDTPADALHNCYMKMRDRGLGS